ncbi:MAG: cell division protein SepF [Clostridiales bacterium]|nr:cell division protein SepF [Clostridiales bacterium]
MANDDFFENFLRNSSNYNGGLEYYEDTHDAYGNYIGSRPMQNGGAPQYTAPVQGTSDAAQRTEQSLNNPTQIYSTAPQNTVKQSKAKPLPTTADGIAAQLNKKFVIYRPRTTADVEQLIAYLRRGEPALVDLDPISESPDAQRLMDFTSGAAYALGDRVITVRRNLFLITPDTMDVLKPESDS